MDEETMPIYVLNCNEKKVISEILDEIEGINNRPDDPEHEGNHHDLYDQSCISDHDSRNFDKFDVDSVAGVFLPKSKQMKKRKKQLRNNHRTKQNTAKYQRSVLAENSTKAPSVSIQNSCSFPASPKHPQKKHAIVLNSGDAQSNLQDTSQQTSGKIHVSESFNSHSTTHVQNDSKSRTSSRQEQHVSNSQKSDQLPSLCSQESTALMNKVLGPNSIIKQISIKSDLLGDHEVELTPADVGKAHPATPKAGSEKSELSDTPQEFQAPNRVPASPQLKKRSKTAKVKKTKDWVYFSKQNQKLHKKLFQLRQMYDDLNAENEELRAIIQKKKWTKVSHNNAIAIYKSAPFDPGHN